MNNILTYLQFESNTLQVFYACLAFVEEFYKERIFLIDKKNVQIIMECEKWIKIKTEEKNNQNFETINISIIHKLPFTKIGDYYEASLIFPKLIEASFKRSFHKKNDKIYFRGLLSNKRIFEIFKFLININEFKSSFNILKKIFLGKRNFIVESSKIYFNFTKRGRLTKFKYLDTEYFLEMSKYKYVYCPKGDFIWTYRFFEAIQVGSIPISKYNIPEYLKFNYMRNNKESILNNYIDENFIIFENDFIIKKRD